MIHGEICARHYATGHPVRVGWRQGMITLFEAVSTPPERDVWIAPALFDLQVNGFAGIDFQQDDLTLEPMLTASQGLLKAGCGRFLLTLVTAEWPKLTARLRRLRELRSKSRELQQAVAGWHVEGPFLSAEPGFHGAHNPAWMVDPTPDHIRELRSITGLDPLLMTIAPERNGALEAIAFAVSLGIKVSLGHTNAPAETLRKAVQAGAQGFTHLGNACPQQLDRHDNILWRVLDTPGLTVSLIPDGIHVSTTLFRLIHRALPKDSICYVTDAMAAASAPPGRYTIGKLEVEVGADQIVRQPGKSNYAGSALRPIDGIFRAAEMLDCPWQEVWDRFSVHPARFIGMDTGLHVGSPADLCVLKMAEPNRLAALQTCSNGELTAGLP